MHPLSLYFLLLLLLACNLHSCNGFSVVGTSVEVPSVRASSAVSTLGPRYYQPRRQGQPLRQQQLVLFMQPELFNTQHHYYDSTLLQTDQSTITATAIDLTKSLATVVTTEPVMSKVTHLWIASEASLQSFATHSTVNVDAADSTVKLSPELTVAVFVIGLVPFVVATIEFWRRIALGKPFGTGSDSVVFVVNENNNGDSNDDNSNNDISTIFIGQDNAPLSSRGRRRLGKGALLLAIALFAVAASVLGLVLASVLLTPTTATTTTTYQLLAPPWVSRVSTTTKTHE